MSCGVVVANPERANMPKFSEAFNIAKTQPELDFVDVSLNTDNRLFVDPFALSQKLDRWSNDAHHTVVTFFQFIIDNIRQGHEDRARELLLHLREPNETRFGYSRRRSQGAGIGDEQAEDLFEALRDSSAVRAGFITSLEESELLIEGISHDKISDLTTNIIRGELAAYTIEQCELHDVPLHEVAMPPCFSTDLMDWQDRYLSLPVYRNRPILLVPKSIVRRAAAYKHPQYYQHFVLNYLQIEELNNPMSRLVRTLRSGRRKVYKKDVARQHPRTKAFLYEFSQRHPEVLHRYRESLQQAERRGTSSEVDGPNDPIIAEALAIALQAIQPGDDGATDYHNLMIGVTEFVFFPHLMHPKKERPIHGGRKRIDIYFENSAATGIFHLIPTVRQYPCAYVPFECKNYTTEVANPELDQLAGRFSVQRGRVGFLCCRHFQNRQRFIESCRDTFTDGRGLILPLDDEAVLRLLATIQRGQRDDIDRLLSELVTEVWVG
jgi:hypothetical protein